MNSRLGPRDVLVLNYYQPWTYAGSERFIQLAREELRQGRTQVFVYVSDAGLRAELDEQVVRPEYERFAVYEFRAPGQARPVSPHAERLTGPSDVELTDLVRALRPACVRAHFPAEDFVPVLETAAYREVPFVYDVMDLWREFVVQPWGDRAVEDYYIARSSAYVAVSRFLLDFFAGPTQGHVVPNAVDRVFRDRIRPSADDARPAGARKRVLYMGGMGGTWFDWELVHTVTGELDDHDFTFIGPVEPPPEELDDRRLRDARRNLGELAARPNVTVVPEVPHDSLAGWLRNTDVGLIPFRQTDLVSSVSPLKVYEYLGAGAEVVQIGMPDIADYPGVRTATRHDEFVDLVRGADRPATTSTAGAEIARFADANTWAARVEQLDRIVAALS